MKRREWVASATIAALAFATLVPGCKRAPKRIRKRGRVVIKDRHGARKNIRCEIEIDCTPYEVGGRINHCSPSGSTSPIGVALSRGRRTLMLVVRNGEPKLLDFCASGSLFPWSSGGRLYVGCGKAFSLDRDAVYNFPASVLSIAPDASAIAGWDYKKQILQVLSFSDGKLEQHLLDTAVHTWTQGSGAARQRAADDNLSWVRTGGRY